MDEHDRTPTFSIHDPAFRATPELQRRRRRLITSIVVFVLAMTVGLVGLMLALSAIENDEAWGVPVAIVAGGGIAFAALYFGWATSSAHRALRKHYEGQLRR